MDVLENFGKWKEFLGSQVDKAQALGVSHERITNAAQKIGEYLSDKVDPKNEQERTLKQLWDVGNEEERHAMASMMVKLTENEH